MTTNKLRLWNATFGKYERMVISDTEQNARHAMMYQLCITEEKEDVSWEDVGDVIATEITGLTGEQIKYRLYWYIDYTPGGHDDLMTIIQYLVQFLPDD